MKFLKNLAYYTSKIAFVGGAAIAFWHIAVYGQFGAGAIIGLGFATFGGIAAYNHRF